MQSLRDDDSQILKTNQAEIAMEIDEQEQDSQKILQESQLSYAGHSQIEASASQSMFDTPKPAETIANPAEKATTRAAARQASQAQKYRHLEEEKHNPQPQPQP